MFLIIKDGIHQHTWDGYNDPMWIRTTMVLSKLAPALARLPRADFTGAEFDAWLVQLDASRNEWPKVRNATAEKAAERTTAYLANPAFNPGTVIDAAARGLLTSVLAGLGKLQEADSADTQVIVEALTVQLRAALADRVVSVDVTLDGGTGPRPAGEAGPVGAAAPADVVEPTPTYPDRALEDGDIVDGVVVPDDDDEDRFDAPKGSTAL